MELNVYNENHQPSCFFHVVTAWKLSPRERASPFLLRRQGLLISWLAWLSLKLGKFYPTSSVPGLDE